MLFTVVMVTVVMVTVVMDESSLLTALHRELIGLALDSQTKEADEKKRKNGLRYSDELKAAALKIFRTSPSVYVYISQLLALPAASTVRGWRKIERDTEMAAREKEGHVSTSTKITVTQKRKKKLGETNTAVNSEQLPNSPQIEISVIEAPNEAGSSNTVSEIYKLFDVNL